MLEVKRKALEIKQWWQCTELEAKEIVTALHIAETMAKDRGQPVALERDLKCKPQMFSRRVDILEIVRPDSFDDDLY